MPMSYTVTAEDETLYAIWNIITYSEPPSSEVIREIISQSDEPVLQLTGDGTDETIDNSLFQGLGDKPLTVNAVDGEGQLMYYRIFDGDYKPETGTFNTNVSVVTPDEDFRGAISSAGAENPLVLNFAASGEIPIDATLRYYVGDEYEDGTVLTLSFYDETTKQLEENAKDFVVTDGWVTLRLTRCSSYVLAEVAPEFVPIDEITLDFEIGAVTAAIFAMSLFVFARRH